METTCDSVILTRLDKASLLQNTKMIDIRLRTLFEDLRKLHFDPAEKPSTGENLTDVLEGLEKAPVLAGVHHPLRWTSVRYIDRV